MDAEIGVSWAFCVDRKIFSSSTIEVATITIRPIAVPTKTRRTVIVTATIIIRIAVIVVIIVPLRVNTVPRGLITAERADLVLYSIGEHTLILIRRAVPKPVKTYEMVINRVSREPMMKMSRIATEKRPGLTRQFAIIGVFRRIFRDKYDRRTFKN